MKINKYICILSATVMMTGLLSACNSFLDVNPKSEVINKDMFSTAEGCEDALFGIYAYISNDKSQLFSYQTSYAIPEILTGNLLSNRTSYYGEFSQRLWSKSNSVTAIEMLWSQLYKTIGYINNAIANLEESQTNFRYMNLYKGEAYALRAFMHFEVAKYFAVSFSSTDAVRKNKALPYVQRYGRYVTPYSSLSEYFDLIIKDLLLAETYLTVDQQLVEDTRTNTANGFTSCRITHLNLYAVQALLARVYWYKNDLDNAEIYASKVVGSNKFPMMTPNEFANHENGVLNLKETIFGLYSTDTSQKVYDNMIKTDNMTLAPHVMPSYETGGNGIDLRLNQWFDTSYGYCTKLLNPTTSNGTTYVGKSIMGVPIISIAEMYFIIADAKRTVDDKASIVAIDNVIASRGLTKYAERPNTTQLTPNEIYTERYKEFIMESLIFMDMKRLGKDVTINSQTYVGSDDATYTMPIPNKIEDDYRE